MVINKHSKRTLWTFSHASLPKYKPTPQQTRTSLPGDAHYRVCKEARRERLRRVGQAAPPGPTHARSRGLTWLSQSTTPSLSVWEVGRKEIHSLDTPHFSFPHNNTSLRLFKQFSQSIQFYFPETIPSSSHSLIILRASPHFLPQNNTSISTISDTSLITATLSNPYHTTSLTFYNTPIYWYGINFMHTFVTVHNSKPRSWVVISSRHSW